MYRIMTSAIVAALLLASATTASATTANFDDLFLLPGSAYYGADGGGDFASQGINFSNSYTDWGGGFFSWDGFAYSNINDTATADFGNQFASYTGTDVSGTGNYGIGFTGGLTPVITLPVATTVNSLHVSNTTYAALSMLNGDGFAKQFGGVNGDDEDFFLLTITGKDGGGSSTGSVDVYLADYRFADNSSDYILDTWLQVDLTSLGAAVKTLEFALASTDNGDFGMNTPAYFALDNLNVAQTPEPASLVLLGLGGSALLLRRREA